jgi:hypothetical protein
MFGKRQCKYFAGNIFTWLECEVYRCHSQYELVNLNLLVTLCSSFFFRDALSVEVWTT